MKTPFLPRAAAASDPPRAVVYLEAPEEWRDRDRPGRVHELRAPQ
jgi:hypothetical protein